MGKLEMCTEFWLNNLQRLYHMEDAGLQRSILLKRTIEM